MSETEKKIFGASITREFEQYRLVYKPLPWIVWLDYGPAWEDKSHGWASEIAHLCLVDVEGPDVPAYKHVIQTIGGIKRACVPAEVIYSLPVTVQTVIFNHLYDINQPTKAESGNSSAP